MAIKPPPEPKAPVMNGGVFSNVWYLWLDSIQSAFSAGSLTLDANQTSTVFTDPNVGASSAILYTPITANAALEIGNGSMYVSSTGEGTFTITHDNNAQTDREFRYTVIG